MGLLDGILNEVGDQHIPGGCDQCDAYQTVDKGDLGVIHLIVHHDDWCPFLQRRKAGEN